MPPSGPSEALILSQVTLVAPLAGGTPVTILDQVSLSVAEGAQIGLAGASGSGKSSLLYLAAGLIPPSSGSVTAAGTALRALGVSRLDAWRRAHVGFIFQDFHLIPELDALDNICLPLTFGSTHATRAGGSALALRLGIPPRGRPVRLMSRGEQQRVAVARALLLKPRLILADAPTASLDSTHGEAVADLIVTEAAAIGATLICASHDRRLLDRLPRRVTLEAGRISSDEVRP